MINIFRYEDMSEIDSAQKKKQVFRDVAFKSLTGIENSAYQISIKHMNIFSKQY